MVTPKGYKKTEIGTIPEDWSTVELGEKTVKVGSGITPTGGERVYKKEGRPFLRSQNVGWGALLLDDIAYIAEETHKSFSSTEIVEGDVFLNITGASIGRSAVANRSVIGGNVNQHVCIVRADRLKLCPRYLNLFLLSALGQKQIESFQAGGNRQGLNFAQIKSFKIILPSSIPEQAAIANVLSDTDGLIECFYKLISKKKAIKQGTMQQLLTGKSGLTGFSQKWNRMTLGEAFTITAGGDLDIKNSSELRDEKYCFPIYSNALTNKGLYGYSSEFRQIENTITVTARGQVGVANPRNHKYTAIGRVLMLVPKIELNVSFVADYINECVSFSNENTGVPQLTAPQIAKYEILLPSFSEQVAIAAVLSNMGSEIESLEKKSNKYSLIKQGMMQQLLTGKIRLI